MKRLWLSGALLLAGCFNFGADYDFCVNDGGCRDAGPPDAGAGDAGVTDAGATDAGPADAGAPDAGPDVGLLCTRSGWCWQHPRPLGSTITALWGTSTSDFWAGTSSQHVLHFHDGGVDGVLTPQLSPNQVTAISGFAHDPGGALVASVHGTVAFQGVFSVDQESLAAQWVPTAGLAPLSVARLPDGGLVLVGFGSTAQVVEGSLAAGFTPTLTNLSNDVLEFVAAGDEVRAVGYQTGGANLSVWRRAPAGWVAEPGPSANRLNLVESRGGGVVVAGADSAWWRTDAGWTAFASFPSSNQAQWLASASTRAGLVLVGATFGLGGIVCRAPATAQPVCSIENTFANAPVQGLNAAWPVGDAVLVGGQRGFIGVYEADGGARVVAPRVGASLTGVFAASPDQVWAVGTNGWLVRPAADGGLEPINTGLGLSDVRGLPDGAVYLSSGTGLYLANPAPGQAPRRVAVVDENGTTLGADQALGDLDSAGGTLWAGGSAGAFKLTADGVLHRVSSTPLKALAVSPAGEVWLLGSTVRYSVDGVQFDQTLLPAQYTQAASPRPGTLVGVTTASADGGPAVEAWADAGLLWAHPLTSLAHGQQRLAAVGGVVVVPSGPAVDVFDALGWRLDNDLAGLVPGGDTATDFEAAAIADGCTFLVGEGLTVMRRCP